MVSAICTLALIVGVLGFATASLADGGVIAPPQPSNPWSYSQTTNRGDILWCDAAIQSGKGIGACEPISN